MSEVSLWEDLNKEMTLSASWHASRVESHVTSAGIPDVDYYFNGDGHIELKFGYTNRTMPKIRDSQVRWIWKRSFVGGKVLILTKLMDPDDKPQYFFHKGSKVQELRINRDYEFWFNNRINDNYWNLDPKEIRIILGDRR